MQEICNDFGHKKSRPEGRLRFQIYERGSGLPGREIGIYQVPEILGDGNAELRCPVEDDFFVSSGKTQVTYPVTIAVCVVPSTVGFFAGLAEWHVDASSEGNVLLSVYDSGGYCTASSVFCQAVKQHTGSGEQAVIGGGQMRIEQTYAKGRSVQVGAGHIYNFYIGIIKRYIYSL